MYSISLHACLSGSYSLDLQTSRLPPDNQKNPQWPYPIQRSIQMTHECLKYNKSVRSPEICKIKPVRFCYLTSKNVFWDPIIGIWRKYMVYRCIHSGDGMHWIHSFSSIHVSPSKRNVFMWHYKSIFSAETWTGGGGEEEGRSCLRARAGAGKGWVEVTLRISQRQIM